ncbi:glycosyltransferase family 1 protein [Metabacillus halosaccharovorans]|uniref:glycosyltransferase family 1 protein n=1 Tax=Metabacillus halosaccharovorans TaxID=930124 RepID=UPI0034CD870A
MGSPIRVLHVVVNMNRGGAETLIMNLYRNIDRSKIQFDFLTCKKGVFDQEILNLGGKIHRIPYITDGGHFHYIKSLKQFFKANHHYKIVHSHMDKMSGFVLKAAKKAGIPVRIAHSHNTQSEGGFAAKIYKDYAGYFISKAATHYMACSKSAAKWLFKEQKAILIKNGILAEAFLYSEEVRRQTRNILNYNKEHFVIGHIGRFNEQKNHSFLIDIFYELSKVNPNARLLLVGDGTLRTRIESKVKELKLLEKVKFLGVRNDIPNLLQAFDVFLFPSLHEGLPVTLIEAQCSGLPCIISDQITEEVDLGLGLVNFNNIKGSPNSWLVNITKRSNRKMNILDGIKSNDYDIKIGAKKIEKIYENIIPRNELYKKESSDVSNQLSIKAR